MPVLAEGQRLGQYRIVRLLGEGGMGAVYEARHESLNRRVALKTLHAEVAADQKAVTRFFNEAKVLSRLEHPSIVQVSDFGTAPDGTSYLVMEYLRGDSLGRRLRALGERGRRLPLIPALQICWQVADVLTIAHSQGVVHRDIKPENLMLVADPIAPSGERVKVLDFGIAKLSGEGERGGLRTDTKVVMGTPMYMSPEQCSGAGRVDDKTDVYALGCVLYQMLAGRPPFEAEGAGELIGMHLFQSPPLLSAFAPQLPSSVVELVHRMIAKDKALRLDMATTVGQIGRLVAGLSGGSVGVGSQTSWGSGGSKDGETGAPVPATTMGQSAGQPINQRRTRVWVLTGGVAMMSVVSIGLYSRLGAERAERTAMGPSAAVRTGPDLAFRSTVDMSKPNLVRFRVETEPAGAFVVNDKGKVVGVTPWTHEQESGPETLSFLLKLDGFVDARLSIDASADATEKIVLKRKQPPAGKQPGSARSTQTEKKREIGYEE